MKYVKVLEPIVIKDLQDKTVVTKTEEGKEEEVKVTFKDFLLGRLADPKFSASMDKVMSVYQIREALKEMEKESLSYLALETSDWMNLKEVVQNPSQSNPYHPLIAFNLIPFMREIINASDSKLTE